MKGPDNWDLSDWQPYSVGDVYSILECPACSQINIISYWWNDEWEFEEDDFDRNFDENNLWYKQLYPTEKNLPVGLPEKILNAYKAAEKIKTIDTNAYAVLLRRLLELICIDREAQGKTLASMLKDLANRGEIPEKLVKVTSWLKDFGNIGAHAGIAELSEKEIPIITALCNWVLEYIYSAPFLASVAENKLNELKRNM